MLVLLVAMMAVSMAAVAGRVQATHGRRAAVMRAVIASVAVMLFVPVFLVLLLFLLVVVFVLQYVCANSARDESTKRTQSAST